VVLDGSRLFQIVGSQNIDIPRNHLEPSGTIRHKRKNPADK
jgi:hypothetical protein